MKKKQLSVAEANLSVLLGNNLDKIKAVHFLNNEQINTILEELFSRPEQLGYSDCESELKNFNSLPKTQPITGELVVLRIIDSGKFPEIFALKLAQYLKNFNRYDSMLCERFILIVPSYKQACDFLMKDWCKLTVSKKNFISIPLFRQHPNLIEQYQKCYYKIMATQSKDANHLVWLVESFFGLLRPSDQELVKPQLIKTIDKIIKKLSKSQKQGFKKFKYVDPNLPTDREIAYELIYQAVNKK